jgi:dolichol kinase
MHAARNVDPDRTLKLSLVISQFIYSAILLVFLVFALLPEMIIAYTYIIVMVFDAGSQITGQLFGRRKIAPGISPNKTIEGFIGGMGVAVICATALHQTADISVLHALLFGSLVCLSAFGGDLLASRYKRICGVKNFSNIIPGHGGMFDRFDGFIAGGAMSGVLGIPFLMTNTPDKDAVIYLAITFLFLFILLSGELLHYFLGMRPEFSRMFSHISAGVISLFLLDLFSSPWYVLVLCIQSAAFLYIAGKKGYLTSHHNVRRKTRGSSLFFAGILIAYLISFTEGDKAYFILPILVLTISDPLAALSGLTLRSGNGTRIFDGDGSYKTWIGSITFFVSSFLILFWGLPYFFEYDAVHRLLFSISISLAAAITEALSSKGFDNLTIPATIIVLLLFINYFIV